MKQKLLLVFLTCSVFFHFSAFAQNIAFPGAEGFGKYTSGGRGGRVIYVTNLNDSGNGSFREAVEAKGVRTILFAVSGTIYLESPLSIKHEDVTIAGQSAPGDGICIANYPFGISADNIIIRYLRFRMGDTHKVEGDAIGGHSGNSNIIIDHCSVSWATDECASFYKNKAFTLQWCIISESLNKSVHQKGEHGYGGIWGGEGATFHHNLISSHKSRTPRFSGSASTRNSPEELVDFRNNVIYNWGINNVYGGEGGRYNVCDNYYKAGPATSDSRRKQLIDSWSETGKFYVNGNILEGQVAINKQNSLGIKCKSVDSTLVSDPFKVTGIPYFAAAQAYTDVLSAAGASRHRDGVDMRIVEEVRSGKSMMGSLHNGLIDSQNDVGGWPDLKSGVLPKDTDGDGIPDQWEQKNKLNPHNPSDAGLLSSAGPYTHLEVYLNSLVTASPSNSSGKRTMK